MPGSPTSGGPVSTNFGLGRGAAKYLTDIGLEVRISTNSRSAGRAESGPAGSEPLNSVPRQQVAPVSVGP